MAGSGVNRHGLTRHIPAEIAQEVRARSKQGCVFCRALICEYEHIDPEFADAKQHQPEDICLVCPSHHSEITRALISKAQVRRQYEVVQRDDDIRPPFYQMMLTGDLTLKLGDSLFENMTKDACVLRYDQERVIVLGRRIEEHIGGSRPSISGTVRNAVGEAIFIIEDNIIVLAKTAFDVVCRGPRITISVDGALAVSVVIRPPNGFEIDRLVMKYRDLTLNFDQTFGVRTGNQSWELPAIESKGARSAVAYDSIPSARRANAIQLVGGKGVLLPGGITLAEGAGQMWIKKLIGQIIRAEDQ